MLSLNRIVAMFSSLKQTVFAILFLTSESLSETPKSTRSQLFSILLMVIDFLQVCRVDTTTEEIKHPLTLFLSGVARNDADQCRLA
jgi:hypothetical protein